MNNLLPDHTDNLPNHTGNHVKWLDNNDVRPFETLRIQRVFLYDPFFLFVRTYEDRFGKKYYTFSTTLLKVKRVQDVPNQRDILTPFQCHCGEQSERVSIPSWDGTPLQTSQVSWGELWEGFTITESRDRSSLFTSSCSSDRIWTEVLSLVWCFIRDRSSGSLLVIIILDLNTGIVSVKGWWLVLLIVILSIGVSTNG